MKPRAVALELRADSPEEAADKVGEAVFVMAQSYMRMLDRAGKETNGPVFMACLLGTMAGFCAAELGQDPTVAVLDLVKAGVLKIAPDGRAH